MNEALNKTPVLSIRDLSVALPKGGDRAHAVRGLSLDVMPGEIVCLVGESGSGKSVTASTVMRLSPLPIGGGSILLEGEDVLAAGKARLRELRGSRISMIFQEPMTALNPVHRVGEQDIELQRGPKRTEESSGGKEGVGTGRSWWATEQQKKQIKQKRQ